MAKGAYIGVGGVAHKIKKGYIGVGGIARKIKKAYVGDENGVARLAWSGRDLIWLIPSMYSNAFRSFNESDFVLESNAPRYIYDITFGNNKFLLINSNFSTWYYSYDGITYTAFTTPLPNTEGAWRCWFTGGRFYVASIYNSNYYLNGAYLYTSTDLITWQKVKIPSGGDFTSYRVDSVCYGNGKYMMQVKDNGSSSEYGDDYSYFYHSTDGIIFKGAMYGNAMSGSGMSDLIFAKGKFIIGQGRKLYTTSEAGTPFTLEIDLTSPSVFNDIFNQIAFGNNILLSLGNYNHVMYSTDFKNWTSITSVPNFSNFGYRDGLSYIDQTLIVFALKNLQSTSSTDTYVLKSKDFINWTQQLVGTGYDNSYIRLRVTNNIDGGMGDE
jgi:hypothetical protein